MIYKVAFIGENQFQWNGEAIPLDEASLRSVIAQDASGSLRADQFIEKVKREGSAEFEVTADKGVIVDMYEVEYPMPADPMKQTEELASHLDERKDFVTQYVFPKTRTEDVLVDLRSKVEKRKQAVTPQAVAAARPKKKDGKDAPKGDEKEETKGRSAYPPEWYAGVDADESMAENTDEGASHFLESGLKHRAWQIIPQLTEQEKQQILRTRRIDYKKLKETYGMELTNWVDVTVPYGPGKPFRAIIGHDVFRYVVAIQEGNDVTNTEVNYDDLVEDGKNPYDFKDVVAYAIENGCDETKEDTTLDELAEGEEVIKLSSKKQAWTLTLCEMGFAWDMNTAEYKVNAAGTDYDYEGAKRDAEEELREMLAEGLSGDVLKEVKVTAEFRSLSVEAISMTMGVIVKGPQSALEVLKRILWQERRIRAEVICTPTVRSAQWKQAWTSPLRTVPKVTEWFDDSQVRAQNVHPVGKNRYFQFIRPIPYKRLVVGQVYGDSYSSTNTGYDVFTFLGYTDATRVHGEGGKAFDTIQEAFKKYGVTSLAELDKKTRSMFREYGHSVYMFLDWIDSPNDPGAYYYISSATGGTARWCRGSGAEPLTFWEVEEVSPLEKLTPPRRR